MIKILTSTALVLAGCCSPGISAMGRPSMHMDLPDWDKTTVNDVDLGHGVHMLESFGGNIGVLAGDDGVLLIDAEWPQLHDKVAKAVANISPQPIRYIVNTHWHWDHVGGDGMFARAGALIFSSEQTRGHIGDAQRKSHSAPGLPYVSDSAAIPVVTISSRIVFHLAGQSVEIIRVPPAHTDGDLIVRFVEADVIQTGDTFFHGFYPDIDEPHGGTIDGMIKLYDTLYAMCGPNTKVIPGHGPVANREDILEYQGMLKEVRRRVANAIAAGQSEELATASHLLDDLDIKWGGNLIKQPYLVGIVYEDLMNQRPRTRPPTGGPRPSSPAIH